MAGSRVDYNRISSTYDSRYAKSRLQIIADALIGLATQIGARRVLEVGCGTGRWLEDFEQRGFQVFGADASLGMARKASDKISTGAFAVAKANQLPFVGETFDLIYCVNAIHHFDSPRDFLRDAKALLTPAGAVSIVGIDPRQVHRWYFYDYFQETYANNLQRYPPLGDMVNWLIADGFDDVELVTLERFHSSWSGRDIFTDPFLAKDSNSHLALLSQEAYDAGLKKIETAVALAEAEQRQILFETELPFVMITGRRV